MKNSLPRELFQSYFAIFVLIITVHLKEREPEHKETPLELILGLAIKKKLLPPDPKEQFAISHPL